MTSFPPTTTPASPPPPPPPTMHTSDGRRASTDSRDSGSLRSPSPTSPTTALILIPAEDDEDVHSPDAPYFEFSDNEDSDDPESGLYELDRVRASAVPPLPPSHVFLFMVAPCLKLGAFLIPDGNMPLKFGIPALIFFAVLSAFARQIWYMLARYVGRADVEDVVCNTFARGPRKESHRRILRSMVRGATGTTRVLLATVYLRESVDMVLPLMTDIYALPSRWLLTGVAGLLLVPLAAAPSLAARRMKWGTGLSVVCFVGWVVAAGYAHGTGNWQHVPNPLGRGALWDGFSVIAFALATTWTVPLYASLKASPRSVPSSGRRSRSFRIISISSMAVATALIFPLLFFSPSRGMPSTKMDTPLDVNAVMSCLSAAALVLTVPTIIITTPSLPLPSSLRQPAQFPLSKALITLLVVVLALAPALAAATFSNLCLLLVLVGNYFLPAFLHITIHHFKRPLSILVPRYGAASAGSAEPSTPLAARDELLVRKERALQHTRLLRRLAWDVGVWVLLLPVGGGGFIWAAGRLLGGW